MTPYVFFLFFCFGVVQVLRALPRLRKTMAHRYAPQADEDGRIRRAQNTSRDSGKKNRPGVHKGARHLGSIPTRVKTAGRHYRSGEGEPPNAPAREPTK